MDGWIWVTREQIHEKDCGGLSKRPRLRSMHVFSFENMAKCQAGVKKTKKFHQRLSIDDHGSN